MKKLTKKQKKIEKIYGENRKYLWKREKGNAIIGETRQQALCGRDVWKKLRLVFLD